MLDDEIPGMFDAGHGNGRKREQSNPGILVPDPGALPEKRSVPFDPGDDPPGQGMVKPAERCARPAYAIMVDLDVIAVNCSEDPPAGALRHSADCSIGCSTPAPFSFPDNDTPFPDKAVHPVLRSAPGNLCSVLELGDRKVTVIKRELPHHAQVFAPVLKYAGHTVQQ